MPLGVEHFCREVAKRAKFGLFHGVPIRHGFKVSERGKNKTKRTWKPNVQKVKLYSELLDRRISLLVTTTALRAIDYHGGLDNYLKCAPARVLKSPVAQNLIAQIETRKAEMYGPPRKEEKSVIERFYIEKVLKTEGRVAYEMVSELTGQRLDKKSKKEVIPVDKDPEDIKILPQPKPVNIEALRKKYGV